MNIFSWAYKKHVQALYAIQFGRAPI